MPWVLLIHGLDQQQYPNRSKEKFQVPDFLVIVETSALTEQPLLVEVKRVSGEKETLKVQDSQVTLCQNYALALKIPLLYAVYWDKFSAWTMNTVDTFDVKTSTRVLSLLKAFEFDCSTILGDVSHLVPRGLHRRSRFIKSNVTPECVQHPEFGRLLSDTVYLGEKQVEMTSMESAVVDSMFSMKLHEERRSGDETELFELSDELCMLKLSSWITRHIGVLRTDQGNRILTLDKAA